MLNLGGPSSHIIQSMQLLLFAVSIILHILFAAGIAKDVGHFNKRGIPTQFVPGLAWVFATLLGGVFVAAIYWLMHHSNLARSSKLD